MQMSAAELDIEPRSEDESDAGSLVDFVCNDDEEIEVHNTDTPVQLLQSAVIRGGARRSTRRCAAPVRYMDPDYVSMMTDDVDIERVLSDTELEADQAAESSEDQDYTASSESESSSEYSEEDSEEDSGEDSEEDSDDSEFYVSDGST